MHTIYAVKRARSDEIICLLDKKPTHMLAQRLAAEITDDITIDVTIDEMDLFDTDYEGDRIADDNQLDADIDETDRSLSRSLGCDFMRRYGK